MDKSDIEAVPKALRAEQRLPSVLLLTMSRAEWKKWRAQATETRNMLTVRLEIRCVERRRPSATIR